MTENIQRLVQAGGRAPSGGNVQPWRVEARVIRADNQRGSRPKFHIDIWLDRQRSDSFLDIERYASLLALGAFAENVAITAPGLGLDYEVEHRDTVSLDAPMIRYRLYPHGSEAKPHPLEPFIATRCTNRKPHIGPSITSGELAALGDALGDAGLLASVADAEGKQRAARVLSETEALRLRNRTLHTQMWSEVRWSREHAESTRDGIDIATLELPDGAAEQLKALTDYDFVTSHVDRDTLIAMSEPAIMASSHLCCLSVPRRVDAVSVMTAGRGLQRLWLTATQLGVSIQPWAVLPFLLVRARLSRSDGFDADEFAWLNDMRIHLRSAFEVPDGAYPLFTFRLARSERPSTIAFRRLWDEYTTIGEALVE